MTPVACERAGPEHLAGLCALFRATGCTCYCRWWHFAGDDDRWQERSLGAGDESRHELERAVRDRSAEALGVVATDAATGGLVGWLKLCPAAAMSKLRTRRPYRGLGYLARDPGDVYVIGCMLVHPAARRRGVARALVEAALALAAELGARSIEAVPRVAHGPVRDEELWTGPPSTLLSLGFEPVAGIDAYPVLKRSLR
jgi:GNAT superfamily N-acetyltransferase